MAEGTTDDCAAEKMAKMKEMENRQVKEDTGFLGALKSVGKFFTPELVETVDATREGIQAASDIKELNKDCKKGGHGLPPAGAQNPSGKGAALGK